MTPPTGMNALQRATQQAKDTADTFPKLLEKMKPQLALVLPKHLSPDRIARIALTEFKKNPELAKCGMASILGSILVISQMGLEIGVNGQAYLVPYNSKKDGKICTPIIGWKGYNELMHRAGRAYVKTGAVYKGDTFEYSLHDGIRKHEAGDSHGILQGDITHFYAEGFVYYEYLKQFVKTTVEVWPIKRLLAHRDRFNKVGSAHYSFENLEPYGRKVLFLQVAKYMPLSVEMQRALKLDDDSSDKVPLDLATAADGSWEFAVEEPTPADDGAREAGDPPAEAAA